MEFEEDKQARIERLMRERKELLEKKLDEDYRELMSSIGGRRLVWNLIADCLVFQPLYHADANVMYLREGKRQIGLNLLARIQSVCPHQYQVMANENATNPIED